MKETVPQNATITAINLTETAIIPATESVLIHCKRKPRPFSPTKKDFMKNRTNKVMNANGNNKHVMCSLRYKKITVYLG